MDRHTLRPIGDQRGAGYGRKLVPGLPERRPRRSGLHSDQPVIPMAKPSSTDHNKFLGEAQARLQKKFAGIAARAKAEADAAESEEAAEKAAAIQDHVPP